MIRDGQAKRIAFGWRWAMQTPALDALAERGEITPELGRELGDIRTWVMRFGKAGGDAAQLERDVIALARWVEGQSYEGERPVSCDSWGAENLDYSPPKREDYDPPVKVTHVKGDE